jgi:hypothetical protein
MTGITDESAAPSLRPGTYELTKRVEVDENGLARFVDMPDGPGAEYVAGFWHKTRSRVRPIHDRDRPASGITDEMIEAAAEQIYGGPKHRFKADGDDLIEYTVAWPEVAEKLGGEERDAYLRQARRILESALPGRAVVDRPAHSGDVDVLATKYDVSILPRDDINRSAWSITVEYRGNDKYAVLIRGHWCLSRDGTSEIEPVRDDRTDEWLADHRFSLDEALRLAVEHAPNVRCNGKTAVELLEWLRERDASGVAGGDTQ